MTKNKKILLKFTRISLTALLTLLWLAFIYGNSLQTGVESGEASGWVHRVVNYIPELLGWGSPISEHFIRKAAHFTEFAILGFLICSDILCIFTLSLDRPLYITASPFLVSVPLCGVFAALDEYLQSFVDGRGPSVTDVFIDTSGALFSTILFITIYCFIRHYRKKFISNNTISQSTHSVI